MAELQDGKTMCLLAEMRYITYPNTATDITSLV